MMAVRQLRTAALENSLVPQEERVNLVEGERRSRMTWAELPIKAKSAIRRLGKRTGPERGICVGGGNDSQCHQMESQKAVELGWSDERTEERKESG